MFSWNSQSLIFTDELMISSFSVQIVNDKLISFRLNQIQHVVKFYKLVIYPAQKTDCKYILCLSVIELYYKALFVVFLYRILAWLMYFRSKLSIKNGCHIVAILCDYLKASLFFIWTPLFCNESVRCDILT